MPRREFLALGDSLTALGYAELVGDRFGVPVVNAGLGGQTPPQIAARYGAIPIYPVLDGGRLVAGPNLLLSLTPEILATSSPATRSIRASIAGVSGVLMRSVGPGRKEHYVFTPQPYERLPIAVPAGTLLVLDLGAVQNDMLLLCVGRNGGIDQPDRLKTSIAAIMATYRPLVRRIVLLGVINGDTPDEYRGTAKYAQILAINADLARLYPDSFLDIRAIYNAAGDPNSAEDQADRAHDVPPKSLRADFLHYNDAGRLVWAKAVGDFIARKGWLKDKRQ